jgi:hypothetical protein
MRPFLEEIIQSSTGSFRKLQVFEINTKRLESIPYLLREQLAIDVKVFSHKRVKLIFFQALVTVVSIVLSEVKGLATPTPLKAFTVAHIILFTIFSTKFLFAFNVRADYFVTPNYFLEFLLAAVALSNLNLTLYSG